MKTWIVEDAGPSSADRLTALHPLNPLDAGHRMLAPHFAAPEAEGEERRRVMRATLAHALCPFSQLPAEPPMRAAYKEAI
jgi:hypothetical protein